MINILVADDSSEKQQQIDAVLKQYFSTNIEVSIEYAQDVINAKKKMSEKNVDILILDLYLPNSFERGVDPNGGVSLIRQTSESVKYKFPEYVICLSRYKAAMEKFKDVTEKIYKTILYDDTSSVWSDELKKTLDFIISCISNNQDRRSYQWDIAVVCALEEELEYVKKILKDVKLKKLPNDGNNYFQGVFSAKEKEIRVVACSARQMGMSAAATLTTTMIHAFIPQYVVMTGIAAGIQKKTNLGDAVVAEYTWDYGAGKEITDQNGFGRHLNTFLPISTSAKLLEMVSTLQQDKDFLNNIAEGYYGKAPDTKFKIVVGPMATGAAVIANPQKIQEIIDNQTRNVVAVEMEAYGMYYAANWALDPKPQFMVIKSVCDYADAKKNDDFHEFAAYSSVKVFERLAKEYFEYE